MKYGALVAVAGLVLSGCGGSDQTTDTGSSPDPTQGESALAPRTPAATSDTSADDTSDTATLLAALPDPYSQADLANGARQFRRCTSCHTLGEGGPNRVGPNLHGLFDRTAGEFEGFNYSAALQDADFQWTPVHVDDWLADPRGYLPGNRMSFIGLRDENDRRDVIAYLLIETAR
tara:strand:+ start:3066 stop:3590 length:525 start_codon:yes stop_codon:yes gene_type:complete